MLVANDALPTILRERGAFVSTPIAYETVSNTGDVWPASRAV